MFIYIFLDWLISWSALSFGSFCTTLQLQDSHITSYEENLFCKIAWNDQFGRRKVYALTWTLGYMENLFHNNRVVKCDVTVCQKPHVCSDSPSRNPLIV